MMESMTSRKLIWMKKQMTTNKSMCVMVCGNNTLYNTKTRLKISYTGYRNLEKEGNDGKEIK